MSLGGIIGATALIVLALPIILYPYLNNRQTMRRMLTREKQQTQDERMTSYERILATLRDLDDDYHTGKLAPDNYQEERTYWTEQGIKLLQEIDPDNDGELPLNDGLADSDDTDNVLDDAVEKAIAAYREAKH